LAATEFGGELNAFAGYCTCPSLRFDRLREEALTGHPFGEVLNQHGATLFLADERTIDDPVLKDFLADPGAYHWAVLNQGHTASENWTLFHKDLQGGVGRK
jgi:hypothetical protein